MQSQHHEAPSWRISLLRKISIIFGFSALLCAAGAILWDFLDLKNHPIGFILSSIDWSQSLSAIFGQTLRYSWVYVLFNIWYLSLVIALMFSTQYYRTIRIVLVTGTVSILAGYFLYQFYLIPALFCLGFEVALCWIIQADLVMYKIKYILNLFA